MQGLKNIRKTKLTSGKTPTGKLIDRVIDQAKTIKGKGLSKQSYELLDSYLSERNSIKKQHAWNKLVAFVEKHSS
jgi:hypothetical protein